MKIIDGQMHVWWPNSPARPWPQGAVSLQGPSYTIEQAIAQLDKAGVQAAALVPPSWIAYDNSYALEASRLHPTRFAVMGQIDHDAPDARQQLAAWRKQPGMLGIRLVFANDKAMKLLKDQSYDWFWNSCEESGVPIMCFAHGNLTLLGSVVKRHPGLRVMVDHAGRNPRGAKDDEAWTDIAELLALAKITNIAVKVSSLPCFSTQPYPFPNLHRHIRAIYDAFGPTRMIWGRDITRLTSSYDENLRLFTEALEFLSPADKAWILGGTVSQWCDWQV